MNIRGESPNFRLENNLRDPQTPSFALLPAKDKNDSKSQTNFDRCWACAWHLSGNWRYSDEQDTEVPGLEALNAKREEDQQRASKQTSKTPKQIT